MWYGRSVAALAAVGVLVSAGRARAQAVITNGSGNVSMGVNREGNLGYRYYALRFNPMNNDGIQAGCECEGWGAGVAGGTYNGLTGYASNGNGGVSNLHVDSFTSTATSATSVVSLHDAFGSDVLRVTQTYTPGASPYLYQTTVTMENLSGQTLGDGASGLRYRRVIDWDGAPTANMEYVTLRGTGVGNIIGTSNDGFAVPNPFVAPSQADLGDPSMGDATLRQNTDFTDVGPADHGALFDLGFGALAPGASRTFRMFWGAAPTTGGLLAAFRSVGAEAYSTVRCDPASDVTCLANGAPNAFGFALAGVGGASVIPEPGSVLMVAAGLAGMGGLAWRRRRAAGAA